MIKEKRISKIITPTRTIVLGFAAIIFVGAFLLTLPFAHNDGEWFPFIDALFTSASAVCVTGLVVVDTATHFSSFGQAIILLLIQIGGLGVMTATTLLFMMVKKRINLKSRLVMREAISENRLQGIVKSIKKILIMTFSIEIVGALILMCSFIPMYGAYGVWVSIFMSVSAFCNAGFDILGILEGGEFVSLVPFVSNWYVCLPIMALIIVGGIGFMVINDVGCAAFKKKRVSINTKMVLITTSILIIFGWVAFLASEWNGLLAEYSVGTKILASLFQSITPRTAGFNSIDQSTLTTLSFLATLLLMFIGASPSSTGGGVKTTTVAVLAVTCVRTLQGEKDVNLYRSKINVMNIRKAMTLVSIAFVLIFVNSFAILAFEQARGGIDIGAVVYEVTSAFSTVGLSTGITPSLGTASKLILILTMFIGRVGALTIGFSLVKSNADQNRKIEYTDAKIMVG